VTPLYPQKLALTSPTGGGRSVGIVRSRTKATEFSLVFIIIIIIITIISFMQGIYTYIPLTNCVPREYTVAAILLL